MITLATLSQATEQEVFDQVARHLLTQKQKAMEFGDAGACVYRTTFDGLRCAAGCLISKEEYDAFEEDIEGQNWRDNVMAGRFPPQHMHLIEGLQHIHDNSETDVSDWPMKLIEFAASHELNAQVVQEVLQNAAQ